MTDSGGPATPSRGAEVVVEHLHRDFGPVQGLEDVSFRVAPAELVLLTGPSGCGKSTLLNLIAGIDRPTSGRVLVDGRVVHEIRNAAEYRRHVVGVVFQLHHLLPMLTARMNVEVPMTAAHVPRGARRERARALLAEVGLADRAGHLPSQLSGGQREVVALARALANEPRLLLADEPTGSLDTASGGRVFELLQRTRERHGTTIIMASHDTRAADHADRVVGMVDGRLVAGYG